MAKLSACMLLAAWLIVTLAVNVRSDGWFDDKRASACVAEMEKVNPFISNWLERMRNVRGKFECSDHQFEQNVIDYQVQETYPWTHKFMNEYLELYLNRCGLEESFAKAIDKFEHALGRPWDSEHRRSLYSYLKSKPRRAWDEQRKNQLVQVVRMHSSLGSAFSEIECTKANNIHLREWILNSAYYEDLHEFVRDYYDVYLVRCGYEDRFQQAIGNLKQLPYEHWDSAKFSTLYNYLMAEFFGPDEVVESLELIYETFKPSSEPTSIACTQEHETNLLKSFFESRPYEYFHKLVGAYVALYFDKCGLADDLKKVTDYIQPFAAQSENFESFPTLFSQVDGFATNVEGMKSPILVIRELSGLVSKFREADCADEHGAHLMQMLAAVNRDHPSLRLLVLAYLGRYLDQCGLEARFKTSINNFAQVWPRMSHEPEDYPTLTSLITELSTYQKAESLLEVLPAIQVLFKFEGFSRETHCNNELLQSLVEHIFVHNSLGNFKGLMFDHFSYYLEVCGLERSFNKRFGAKLSRCLSWANFDYGKSWQQLVMSIMSELSKSPPRFQRNSDCSKNLIRDFSTFLAKIESRFYTPIFYPETKEQFARYRSRCERQS